MAVIIATLTLIAGEITKLFNVPSKFIPAQNLIIAIIASIICIIFHVEDMTPLEAVITCVFGTMSAGGLFDLTKISKKEAKHEYKKI